MVSVHLEQISEESLWNTDDEERWKSCVLKKKKIESPENSEWWTK